MDIIDKLDKKEEFLLDLTNNNYSVETIYNYGRDLTMFEIFLSRENLNFENINKVIISKYKGFLIKGEHINELKKLQDEEKENIKWAGSPEQQAKDTATGSKGSKSDELKKVDKYIIGLKNNFSSPLAPRSINRMLSALRSYIKYLIDNDYDSPIPSESIKLIKAERKESQVADLSDLIRLVESPEYLEKDITVGLRNRAILELLFSTGMRISELVNLNRDQLNTEGKVYIMGKGKKARFVYLTERARGVLEKYLETRDDPYPALFIPYRGTRNSTKNPHFVRISTNYIQMKIKEYRQKLGIVIPTSAHSLRHGFATYLAEEGANPAAIQRLLGHESLQTTTRYVHGSDKFAEETHRKYHPLKD